MTIESSFAIDSQFLADQKKVIRERIIPWEGLSRANIISEDEANYIKILEKQSTENKNSTIANQVKLYASTLLNLLNKLDNNPRDDVLKSLLCLVNDLLIDLPEFGDELIKLTDVDAALPFEPFVKYLGHTDSVIKTLSLYNLTVLLVKASATKAIDDEIVSKAFREHTVLIHGNDVNYKFITIQLLQYLLIIKPFKLVYLKTDFAKNFKSLASIIDYSVANENLINSSNLQLIYNTLLNIWILSFNPKINKLIYQQNPQLIGDLLTLSKDSIKIKIIRISVSILKNFVSIVDSSSDKFKIIKVILHNDGLSLITNLKSRKISSNGSDEELTGDLNYLFDELNDIVKNKLTSFDEYLTELETPNLLSWSSPTHKSSEFWLENSNQFKENNFKLVKKIFEVLGTNSDNTNLQKVILLSDLQYLIGNLGQDLVDFINGNKDYKLLIMNLLDTNNDNELKYQSLKTIQLLVGHTY
ncbi:H(+)-transporting V1 sector ATPase subunit H [Yamadazyma tenuis]|uniref:V-type proton ATPase subunit H n=1 Tax=Candida tenuis (strain ATCC 10573 / BCRC 21748 / CBS 615 / JCM 9827 / NBRC 10315 / NRRL Y-1498 / VKM Y-70) TaxID=590646 RepID=G3AWE3_CANTC|nr:ATPase, V1 complex, subunit H [Yamadazyma tenuis ATCC 10573]EGV66522.1 ATPase, V1 complex, subunit H [Yamadazyma tenuis ATCC 10573]WEJ95363.1 H(+)-transporting V1 sector ATPase subunit H [Yamadazyma tenuis]